MTGRDRKIKGRRLMQRNILSTAGLHLLKTKEIRQYMDASRIAQYLYAFYDYRDFHHEKFPNISVSIVSELHNYSTRIASSNQDAAIPSFRTNLH